MNKLLFFKRADLLTQVLCLLLLIPAMFRLHMMFAPGIEIIFLLQVVSIILNWRIWPPAFRSRFRPAGVLALLILVTGYLITVYMARHLTGGAIIFNVLTALANCIPLAMVFYSYITFDEATRAEKGNPSEAGMIEMTNDNINYRKVYRYKQADIVIQLLAFVWSIIFMLQSDNPGRLLDILSNSTVFIIYFVVGGVQLVSAIANKIALAGGLRVQGRKWYEGILGILIILLVMSIFIHEMLMVILIALVFISPLLAVGYLWLTIAEFMKIRKAIPNSDDNITE